MATTDRRTATLALAHALSAAEHGLPVIPLSATKLPALRSPHRDEDPSSGCRGACGRPGHGVHDATTDPIAVRALFAAAPWATGYGIACGRAPHHLIGIDLDIDAMRPRPTPWRPCDNWPCSTCSPSRRPSLCSPPAAAAIYGCPAHPAWPYPTPCGRLAPGIDIRGSGGYLVGPGSVTAHGIYRLVSGTGSLPPAPCPSALLHLLTPPARPRHHHLDPDGTHSAHGHPDQGRGLVQFVLAADEGQRNTRLFWAACRAYENGFGDALADALTRAAVGTGLPEHEARATIASAARLTHTRCEPPR